MKNSIILITFLIASIIIPGCKTKEVFEKESLKATPELFPGTNNSINTANINWRQFFTDSVLISLIDNAIKNNLDVLMTFQKIETARADLKMSKGMLFPAISGGIVAGQSKFGKYTMDGAGNEGTYITETEIIPEPLPDYYINMQTSWEIDLWKKLRNKKKASMNRFLGSIEGKNIAITNLIAEVANLYYELLGLDSELEIIRETIKLHEEALKIVTIQKEAAVATALGIRQFEAQVLNSKGLEKEIEQRIILNENTINFLLGRFPQSIIRKKTIFSNKIPMQVKLGIPSDLLANRPDIKQAEFELSASKADLKAAKAAFYPSLYITGSFGYQAFKTSLLFNTPQSLAYNLFGNLTAPLINRSMIKAQFLTAQAAQLDALYNYQKAILSGYVEVYNEMAKINNLQKMYDLKMQEVNALNQSIEIVSELFKNGRANYLEILITQQNLLQAKIDLINVKQKQFSASINIYKALGGGWK